MTTLHHRLADLADDAPLAETSPGLWERGQRYRRRRRIGTAVAAGVAVTAVVAVLGVSWLKAQPPDELRPAQAPLGMPDHLFEPSPWLPGTVDEGPTGPLAVVFPAMRGSWTGTSEAYVGVSATTGKYRFLDLPDFANSSNDVALSPDGRRVAYGITGPTRKSPNRVNDLDPVVGIGVWDAVTGDVDRWLVPTDHGIREGSGSMLRWADSDHLLLDFGQIAGGEDDSSVDQSLSIDHRLWYLDVTNGGDLGDVPGLGTETELKAINGHGKVVVGSARRLSVIDLATASASTIQLRGNIGTESILNPAGTRLAGLRIGPHGRLTPNKVIADDLGSVVDLTEVPASAGTFRLAGWVDDDRVLALRDPERTGGAYIDEASYYAVNVVNGDLERMVTRDPGTHDLQFATDLLASPIVSASEPPSPLDPRITVGLLVVTLGAAVTAVVGWRRRVRP
jgi:hypothetical protein